MAALGRLAVCLALLCAVFAVGASVAGAARRRRDLIGAGANAAYAVFGLVAVAVAILLRALLAHDFSLEYVAAYSSSTLPVQYTVAALWGGQKGSLLFWVFVLALFTTLVQLQNREQNRALMPWVTATLMAIAVFFLALLTFVTDPFELLATPAREGQDLNPLLQNYWMMIHPPSLYTGYVSASVPFAFAIAALVTGRLDDQWIRSTRRWALFSWFFLSLGNLFGARWAYEVLGWGGYWAWDPVENAAFMPWLVSTAYLHSVMIQEKRDLLRVWNMVLVLLTFTLTIFGTFLTRSGVISSVHSFTQSGLGPFFIGFLVAVILAAGGLVAWRLPALRCLIGVGPVIAWRRATPRNLRRAFAGPLAAGLVAAALLRLAGVPFGWAHATFALGAFVLGTIVQEFYRGVRARQAMLHEPAPRALARLVGKN